MDNQYYKINFSDDAFLEIRVSERQEGAVGNRYWVKDILLTAWHKGKQLDESLDSEELDSLIDFLRRCRRYINKHKEQTLMEHSK